jgi:hypothetical protein
VPGVQAQATGMPDGGWLHETTRPFQADPDVERGFSDHQVAALSDVAISAVEMRSFWRVNRWGGVRPCSAYVIGHVPHGGDAWHHAEERGGQPFFITALYDGLVSRTTSAVAGSAGGPFPVGIYRLHGGYVHANPQSGNGPGLYSWEDEAAARWAAVRLQEFWAPAVDNPSAAANRQREVERSGPRPVDWEYR